MEKIETLKQSGFKMVGTGGEERGVGVLFGFPVKAIMPTVAQFKFVFSVTEEVSKSLLKELTKEINMEPTLQNRVTLKTEDDTAENFTTSEVDTQKPAAVLVAELINPSSEEEVYKLFLETLENLFTREDEIAPQSACPFCGEEQGDALSYVNSAVRLVHNKCLQEWHTNAEKRFEDRAFDTGYLKGVIGGLVGGIAGAIPAAAALFIFNYFVWILFAVIPIGISFGWNLTNAKRGIVTAVFTIVYTLILAVTMDAFHTFFYLRDALVEIGVYGFAFGDVIDLYTGADNFFSRFFYDTLRDDVIRNTLMALGSAIVGIVIAWRWIATTDKGQQKIIDTVISESVTL